MLEMLPGLAESVAKHCQKRCKAIESLHMETDELKDLHKALGRKCPTRPTMTKDGACRVERPCSRAGRVQEQGEQLQKLETDQAGLGKQVSRNKKDLFRTTTMAFALSDRVNTVEQITAEHTVEHAAQQADQAELDERVYISTVTIRYNDLLVSLYRAGLRPLPAGRPPAAAAGAARRRSPPRAGGTRSGGAATLSQRSATALGALPRGSRRTSASTRRVSR